MKIRFWFRALVLSTVFAAPPALAHDVAAVTFAESGGPVSPGETTALLYAFAVPHELELGPIRISSSLASIAGTTAHVGQSFATVELDVTATAADLGGAFAATHLVRFDVQYGERGGALDEVQTLFSLVPVTCASIVLDRFDLPVLAPGLADPFGLRARMPGCPGAVIDMLVVPSGVLADWTTLSGNPAVLTGTVTSSSPLEGSESMTVLTLADGVLVGELLFTQDGPCGALVGSNVAGEFALVEIGHDESLHFVFAAPSGHAIRSIEASTGISSYSAELEYLDDDALVAVELDLTPAAADVPAGQAGAEHVVSFDVEVELPSGRVCNAILEGSILIQCGEIETSHEDDEVVLVTPLQRESLRFEAALEECDSAGLTITASFSGGITEVDCLITSGITSTAVCTFLTPAELEGESILFVVRDQLSGLPLQTVELELQSSTQ